MKSGKTLTELAIEIERRANAKKDMLVAPKDISMVQNTGFESGPVTVGLRIGGKVDFGINSTAHQQIAEHVDIPKKYYDRMMTTNPALLATNVNAWFAGDKSPRLLRTLDGNARALLSDRYRPLENEDLAAAVLPALKDLDLEVMSSEITERRFYLKVVDKRVIRELEAVGGKFGDGAHKIVRCMSPAVTISNSEIGMGALSVLAGIYDSFCSNLASFGERSSRKYHVGAKNELGGDEIYALLSDSTRRKTDAALWAQIGDVVRAAFNQVKFDELVAKISETTTQKIEGDPIKVISFATKRLDMAENEGTQILRHLIEGGDLSRFGLYNAITRTAQDLPDYDRATEFERLGGKLLELPKKDWQEMAQAA